MRWSRIGGASLAAVLASQSHAGDARACGGCFVQQAENTQVVGHRMVLSISNAKTTLVDQIGYSGDPSSFAWVLPIQGVVDVGVSSDAMFEALEAETALTITSPIPNCPGCGGAGVGGGGPGGYRETRPVQVIAQEVVGPYETVQLSSADPAALNAWLDNHGYAIPAEIQTVIEAYVADGFDFLAVKLVPGSGIDSMRPLRVTYGGASLGLPLRLVAAGAGAKTPVALWILSEGRYEPANFPTITVDEFELSWNWNTQSSNYSTWKSGAFDASGGKAWLVEVSRPMSKLSFESQLTSLARSNPIASGYGGPMGENAVAECMDDLDALLGGIDPASLRVTRLAAELSKAALADDLAVAASADQSTIWGDYYASQQTGTPPCPCDPSTGAGASGGNRGMGGTGASGPSGGGAAPPGGPPNGGGAAAGLGLQDVEARGGACSIGTGSTGSLSLVLGLLIARLASRRRESQRGR